MDINEDMDVDSKEVRSYNMSQIKGQNTKPEEIVRKYLFAKGFRYRKNDRRLPDTPDIVLPKYKAIIFVNGCFWHGHERCERFKFPKTNSVFWKEKINKNIKRDCENNKALTELGWEVLVIWECQLKAPVREKTLEELCVQLRDNRV